MAEQDQVDIEKTTASGEFLDHTIGIVCPVCGLEVTGGFNCCPNDGTKLFPDPGNDLALSDKYEALQLIGEGGMSSIYKARHKLIKRTVAIKLLHSHFHKSPETIQRFKQEAEAISSMSHENVVNVFDFGQLQHGQPYMVMNYVDGRSLSQLIKAEGPVPIHRALKFFKQIANGLHHAHSKRIVHRDLKPTNIMMTIDANGAEKAVIVDFGIAKVLSESEDTTSELTKTGAVIGSPHYMSPEQCLGRTIDLRSDIYSFGCLMYETLIGKPLFAGDSALETMHKQVTEKAPNMPTLSNSQTQTACMQAIINHAIEKDPAKRYQSINDLSHDLSLLGAAIEKGNTPTLTSLKAFESKN